MVGGEKMKYSLVVGLLSMLCACKGLPPPSLSEVPGRYVFSNSGFTDVIVIGADGTYEHTTKDPL